MQLLQKKERENEIEDSESEVLPHILIFNLRDFSVIKYTFGSTCQEEATYLPVPLKRKKHVCPNVCE